VEYDRRALGAHGEELAARWYARHGYVVLARNWRSRQGELDVVAGRPGLIVFCEVKTRTTPRFGSGAEAVAATKQARLRRLAAEWLALRSGAPVDVRFDVAVVHRGVELEIVESAF
jgi:putative endonuclease